jgi:hypothetical protein
VFTGDAREVAFAFPGAIEESGKNLGQLLSVLGVRDEVVAGAADTLAAAQGADSEAAEDEDQDMVYEDAHSLHLVGDLLHLDKDLLERQTHTNQMGACFLLILT